MERSQYQIIAKLALPSPTGTLYWSTHQDATDGAGVADKRLESPPSIRRGLTDSYFGLLSIGEVTLQASNLDGALSTLMRQVECRGAQVTIIRKDLMTNATSTRFVGIIQSVSFTQSGTVEISCVDINRDVLDQDYPRVTVRPATIGLSDPTVTTSKNETDTGLTAPIVFGASREHTPCRFIQNDTINEIHRYLLSCDLSPTSFGDPIIRPYPNTLYRSTSVGSALVRPGEYEVEWQQALPPPPSPVWFGASGTGLTGSAGTIEWCMTVFNLFGESPPSPTVTNAVTLTNQGAQFQWVPAVSENVGGFRVYRKVAGVFCLIKEIKDIVPYRQTVVYVGSGGVTGISYVYVFTDTNLATILDSVGATINPPAVNGTRSGFCVAHFPLPQFGDSSNLTDLMADMEMTEISSRADSLALWYFRDDVRDIAVADRPRLVTTRYTNFWDFRDRPQGAPDVITDRVGSTDISALGTTVSGFPTYKSARFGYSACNKFVKDTGGVEYFTLDGSLTGALNFDTTKSFRIEAYCRPDIGSAQYDKMTVLQKGTISGNAGWELSIKRGQVTVRLTDTTARKTTLSSLKKIDGAWHKLAFEVDRSGTASVAGTPLPTLDKRQSFQFRDLTTVTNTFVVATNTNRMLTVCVTAEDSTAARGIPTGITYNGIALTKRTNTETTNTGQKVFSSIWDLQAPTQGSFPLVVTFPGQVDRGIIMAHSAYNMKQAVPSAVNSAFNNTVANVQTTSAVAVDGSWIISCAAAGDRDPDLTPVNTTMSEWVDTTPFNETMRGAAATQSIQGGSYTYPATIASGWTQSTTTGRMAVSQVVYDPLVGAVPTVRDTLKLFIDDVQDGDTVYIDTASANRIDSMVNVVSVGGAFRVGSDGSSSDYRFRGMIEWFGVLTLGNSTPVTKQFSFVGGKSNSGNNSLDMANGVATYCPDVEGASIYNVGATNFTLEGWVKLSSIGATQYVATKWASGSNGYALAVTAAGKLQGIFKATGITQVTTTGTTTLVTDRWYYVAMVVQRESLGGLGFVTLFLDGVQDGTPGNMSLNTPPTADNTLDFVVGALTSSGTSKLSGVIDELHLFQGLRTVTDARKIWAMGKRNVAEQVAELLEGAVHGPGLIVDTTTRAGAIAAISAINGASPDLFVSDYALVEQKPLRQHLAEMMKLRGLRISMTSSGQVQLDADTQRSIVATFGWHDGIYENLSRPPIWSQIALDRCVKTSSIEFRPRRNGNGGINNYVLQTTDRSVLSVGSKKTEVTQAPALRDRLSADVFADYYVKRLMYGDVTARLETGDAAVGLTPGDLVTILDPENGMASVTHEVQEVVEDGAEFTITTVGWNAAIYTYASKELPADQFPETDPDFSATYPNPPTSVTIERFTTSYAYINWLPGDGAYSGAAIWYRKTQADGAAIAEPVWVFVKEIDDAKNAYVTAASTTAWTATSGAGGIDKYEFGVSTRSPAKLFSIISNSASQQPT
jgi:hypothetical protein